MRFKKNLVVIFLSIMILVCASAVMFTFVVKYESQTAEAFIKRYDSYLLADELRQSSDDLTRMVRSYVVTGDKRYREYFQRILDIRSGEAPRPDRYSSIYWDFVVETGQYPSKAHAPISLDELIKRNNFSAGELALLREGERRSQELVAMETKAINAMVGNYQDEKGEYTVSRDPDPKMARKLLYGEEYHIAKANVMRPLGSFFDSIDLRTSDKVSAYRGKKERLGSMLMVTMGLSILLVGVSLLLIFLGQKEDQKEEEEDKITPAFFRASLASSWPIVTATVVVIFMTIGLSWWFVSDTKELVHRGIRSKLSYDLTVSRGAVVDWIERVQLEVDFLSDMVSRRLNDYAKVKKRQKSGQGVHEYLVNLGLFSAKFLEDYILVDPRGTVLSSNRVDLVGKFFKLPSRMAKRMEESNRVVIFPQGAQEDDDKALTENIIFAANLKGDHGSIYFMISPEAGLGKIFRSGFTGDTGEIYMVNSKGVLLTDSRWKNILVDKGWVKKGSGSLMQVKVAESQHPDAPLTKSVQAVIAGRDNFSSLSSYRNYLGHQVIGFWSWDNTHQFGIVSEMEVKEALGFFRSYTKQNWVSGGFTVFLIITLLLIFIWNRVKMAKVNDELLQTYKTIKQQNEKHAKDLEIGQRVQMDMLPNAIRGDYFSLGAFLTPAQSLSGDFYDFGLERDNRLYFCIGDVSGKGVAASLFMSMSKVVLRRTLDQVPAVKDLVTIANNELSKNNDSCMFVTLIVGVMELQTGIIDLVNAGHNPPYIKKSNSGLMLLEEVNGPLVGSFEGAEYRQQSIKMSKGDTLLLYTDGVTEAQNIRDEFYHESRLENHIKNNQFPSPQHMVNSISHDVQNFIGEANQFDDITIMALQYTGVKGGDEAKT